MLVITTFPPWGWDVYAKHCIDTWLRLWPGSIRVYYEGNAPPALDARIDSRPLDELENRTQFLDIEAPPPRGFLYDVKRFCHKVFAQLDVEEEKFWWLDADVELKKQVPSELIAEITDKAFVSFLGRSSYTETGVIAFNTHFPEFWDFSERYEKCYLDGLIYSLPGWTDCHAFDWARQGQGNNLTPDGMGFDNVLRDSVLGEYMEHHKGKLKLKLEER